MRGLQIVPTHLNGVSADVPAAQRHRQVPQMLGEACDVCCAATQAAVPGIEAENVRLMLNPGSCGHAAAMHGSAALRHLRHSGGGSGAPVSGTGQSLDLRSRSTSCAPMPAHAARRCLHI